ncbi:hypothetical protein KFK09_006239 [Dendrobium nobile]|uniref:MADS-box domain-containing protein n=1 Tax=Dendrobium nobile TaxID=94219 RepID=A0A8T3BT59_DENNO|nr:hypothetical protein KFK09_006239 [Dendrobium nobile]
MMNKKRSIGRQKIEIKPIKKEEARQVCFSKRRNGLFKKASELSTLCGAEICIVVFSPAGKAFSFGHPSVDVVAHRFLADAPALPSLCEPFVAATAIKLNEDYAQLNAFLEKEKMRRAALDEALTAPQLGTDKPFWRNGELESMGLEELEELRGQLTQLRSAVAERANQLLAMQQAYQRLLPQSSGNNSFSDNRLLLASPSGFENRFGYSVDGLTFCSFKTEMKPDIYGQLPSSSLQPFSSARFGVDHYGPPYYVAGLPYSPLA